MTIELPKDVKYIIRTLSAEGFEGFAVGGCVRDVVMGREPNDWDIATSAPPLDVTRIFRRVKRAVVPTGIEHGTVTVIIGGRGYEVTTYRLDGAYSDGRRPDAVTFTADLTEDLRRRDFTINAMAYNETAGLVDPFDGIADLERRLIRCVGSAEERFGEDYLRMLRAYRFAATLGFDLDGDVRRVVRDNKAKIKNVAAERIRAEFDKTIAGGGAAVTEFLELFLPEILPEAVGNEAFFAEYRGNNHIARLARLLWRSDKAETALRRLRYDNATIKSACGVIQHKDLPADADKPTIKRALKAIGEEGVRHLRDAQMVGNDFALDEILSRGEPYTIGMLNVTGADVMAALNVKQGRAVGAALAALLDKVIDEPSLNKRNTLLNMLKD